ELGEAAPGLDDDSVTAHGAYGWLGALVVHRSAGCAVAASVPPGMLMSPLDPVDYEAVLGQSGDIVTNVVEVTASLRVVLQAIERGEGLLGAMVRNRELGESTLVDLQHTMANVQDTTRSLEDILQRLNHGEGILGRLTRNTKEVDELFARVNHAAKSLDQLSDRLNRGRGTVGKLMEDEAYATRVLGNLDTALKDLKDVAEKLDRGDGTLGKLVNDPSLYHDAKALVGTARRSWLLGVH